ncbi:MAG: OmpH/Skp family outer membrane protein [Daejeonella sp.]
MKKKIYFLATALMLMLASPSLMAKDAKSKPDMTETQKARFAQITSRVQEIKSMDRSELSSEERKALRNELQNMKKEAKAMSGGVYLSIGAIIIIILLLILIL